MKTAQEVGANVRAEMARAGITQTRLGESLGLPQSAVSKRLRGARAFTVDELIRCTARATSTPRCRSTRPSSCCAAATPSAAGGSPDAAGAGTWSRTASAAPCRRRSPGAGYDDVTAHMLRHWFGTHAQRIGKDARVTQALMRHASLQSTQLYTEVADHRKTETVRRLTIRPWVRR